ncbi:hypothetical protein B0A48_17655 [Cryoendolithus antarcticus]|uniref:DUF6590 domain-containing protein n=1 Tax=Cryoendolithus antarcticus TaxID=1507870 RepID=A0A1V8SBG4_9PEZI|nr:hypothetical protein B0A48_17655 [Cryoendolithus antarcticus]
MPNSQRTWLYSPQVNAYYYHDHSRGLDITEDGRVLQSLVPSLSTRVTGSDVPRTSNRPQIPSATVENPPRADAPYLASAPRPLREITSDHAQASAAATTLPVRPRPIQNRAGPPPRQPRREDLQAGLGISPFVDGYNAKTLVRSRVARSGFRNAGNRGQHNRVPPERQLLETPGDQEVLDPSFRKRKQPRAFFVIGRVFLTLWSEPASESLNNSARGSVVTQKVTLPGKFAGERVYSDVRRFVVINTGPQSCTALPVRTFGGRGARERLDQAEIGIIYTGTPTPRRPSGESRLLPRPIRVDPDDPRDPRSELHSASRIHYGTVYTVEHNLKVKPLGMVNRDCHEALVSQFQAVFTSKILRHSQVVSMVDATSEKSSEHPPLSSPGRPSSDRASRSTQPPNVLRHLEATKFAEVARGSRPQRHESARTTGSNDGPQDEEVQGTPSQLAELTRDEQQRLKDVLLGAIQKLKDQGLSTSAATSEAKAIVNTLLTKMVSNARERSQASASRRQEAPRGSAETLGVRSTIAPENLATLQQGLQTRRLSMSQPQDIIRPRREMTGASLPQGVAAMSSRTAPAAFQLQESTIRAHRASNMSDQRPRIGQSESGPSACRTEVPPAPQGSSSPSYTDLAANGWQPKEATAFRNLMDDGLSSNAAQLVINMLRKGGISLGEAKAVARAVDRGLSLEVALQHVRDAVSASTSADSNAAGSKGKGRQN